ncbi:MAG: VOC family protein [Bacteroidia bacterium]|jgi:catechol 2,3-dioxygenase-like lactoylglutathione lyase family enzyme|nr:VOC family protein [Bacteroidia bacterium]MCC6767975.1 VOC family protein [Bacteroidia bacterium]
MKNVTSVLSGIQQIGIGVKDADKAFAWYRKYFGMDIPVFKDASKAGFMTPYTGGEVRSRYAILAINIQGGGGFEIWQFTDRDPQLPAFLPQPGDLGINGIIIKSRNVEKSHAQFRRQGLEVSDIFETPWGSKRFHLNDPWNNRFTFTEGKGWFRSGKALNGGIAGAQIGVSDIDRSVQFYQQVIGADQVVSDTTGISHELGRGTFRRVLLRPSAAWGGAFSRLLGPFEIELIQSLDHPGRKIYEGRFWGDPGFIHLCFDVNDMVALENRCNQHGFPFTVNSGNSFDMGEAAGQFTYCEDPDGTLIEFVKTYRLPVMKKWGWYLNLEKRDQSKPLPDWILGGMRFQREKD